MEGDQMKREWKLGIAIGVIMALVMTQVILADGVTADADALVLQTPHENFLLATQNGGTTVVYNFSAAVNNTGNATNDVFVGSSDSVSVSISRTGDWLAGGAPGSFTFTTYLSAQSGTIAVTVPCGFEGTTKTMTVALTAGTSTNGKTLAPAGVTLSYDITAGPDDASCAPVDTTPPVIGYVLNPASPDGANGWYKSNVTLTWTVTENESPSSLVKTGCVDQNITADQAATTYSCSATSHGGSAGPVTVTIKRDATAPTEVSGAPNRTPDHNGWYNHAVDVVFTGSDATSDIDSCSTVTYSGPDGTGRTVNGSCTDNAGNTSAPAASSAFDYDATAPTGVSGAPNRTPDHNGWYNHAVDVVFTGSDATSDIDSCSTVTYSGPDGTSLSVNGSCTDNAGNTSATVPSSVFKLDKTGPSAALSAVGTLGNNGWYTDDVTVSTSGTDSISTPVTCTANQSQLTDTVGAVFNGSCTNDAGLTTNAAALTIKRDATAPTVSLVGGPANGSSYYFGSVPAAPTCNASDATSGLAGACNVSGYSAAVGSHTVAASATDNAGNSASASATYTVLAWTLNGFYQPVDMNGVYNTVRNGSTVPLKFEVFAGSTELMGTSAVQSFVQTRVNCDGTAPQDDIEFTTTGGTSLRYDTTAGQFVQNWQTPRIAGACYRVMMTTLDGSSLAAFFKLK
jgi:hypothetical protein